MKKSYVAEVHFLEKEGVYLTTEQAAEYVGKSARALEDMRRRHKGPRFVKLEGDKRILYKRSDLMAWYYNFETTGVRSSEAKLKLESPAVVDYKLLLEGDDTVNLAGNIAIAISNIRDKIFEDMADGFLCFEYSCCKIKAQLYVSDYKNLLVARYCFMAE